MLSSLRAASARMLRKAAAFVFRILRKPWNEEIYQTVSQFVRFLLVGLTGSIVQLLVYYLLLWIGGSEKVLLWNTIAYCAAVADMIFLNSRIVFPDQPSAAGAAVRSALCYVVTYLFQQALLYLFHTVLQLPELLPPLLAMLLSCPVSFLLNKLFAFGKTA